MRGAILAAALLGFGHVPGPVHAEAPRAAPLAKGDHVATLAGERLWYRVKGNGPLLLALSTQYGIGSTYLERGFGPLEQHHTMVYVDLRGNGHSPIPHDLGTISTRSDVADLERLRRYWGLKQLSVLGHSGGGAVALGYAETYPEHAGAVILVDTEVTDLYPSPGSNRFRAKWRNDPEHALAVRHYDDPVHNDAELNANLANTLAWYLADPAKNLPAMRRNLEGIRIPWTMVSSWMANDKREAWKQSAQFGQVTAPTLILEGREDAECPIEIADAAHQGIHGSQEVVFEHSGHLPWLEEPAQFFEAVEGFLAQAGK